MGVNVMLVGATGAVGRLALKHLLNSTDVSQVQVLTRRSLDVEHPKLLEIITDLIDPSALTLEHTDVFLCALGTTIKQAGSPERFYQIDKVLVEACAQLALQNGARHAGIISCIGANPNAKGLYLRTKGDMEHELSQQPWQSVTFIQPSLLLGHRDEFRLGEALAAAASPLFNWLLVGPLKAYRAISVERVALALAKVAQSVPQTKPEAAVKSSSISRLTYQDIR